MLKTQRVQGATMRDEFREARVDLAAVLRWSARGYQQGVCNHFSFLFPGDENLFLVNPEGFFWSELTASSLLVCDLDGGMLKAQARSNAPRFVCTRPSTGTTKPPRRHCTLTLPTPPRSA